MCEAKWPSQKKTVSSFTQMEYKWTYIDLQKQIFIPNPLILMPVTLGDSSFILFSFVTQKVFCPSSRTCDDQLQLVIVWQKEHRNVQKLISLPGRNIRQQKSHVRTSVYTGKLKGNQVSRISPNRNKIGFRGKGWGRLKGEGGVNAQLILQECKGTAVCCNVDNPWLNQCPQP